MSLAETILHPRRSLRRRNRPSFPTIEEFRRMGPEKTAEWHRLAGIESHLVAALSEADKMNERLG